MCCLQEQALVHSFIGSVPGLEQIVGFPIFVILKIFEIGFVQVATAAKEKIPNLLSVKLL